MTTASQACGYGDQTLAIGQRIEGHPASDRWMRGDRYGVIEALRLSRGPAKYRVRFDKSNNLVTLSPESVRAI